MLRFFAGLWLVFAIAYTPIHLYLEPHSQGSGVGTGTALAQCGECAVGAAHDGDNDDDRHCVQQHQLVTSTTRALVAERMPVQAMKWVDGHEGFSHTRVAGPLGLSPPRRALLRRPCWSTVFIEAKVPELRIGRLAATKSAAYELPGQEGQFMAITGDTQGRWVFLGIQVDPATRTVPLVYEVQNADLGLRVGQSVNLYVETERVESAVAIPNEAIVEEGGRPIAFVQVGGETFQKRDLTLGIRDGNWVQVLSGIEEDEQVVTRGAYAVRLASVSTAIPAHGHAQ